jgi:hypothetical protein
MIASLLLITCLIPLAYFSCADFGCGQRPRLDVTPTLEDGRVVFNVPFSDVNGILRFTVEDELGKLLWDVDTPYYKGHTITFGVPPRRGDRVARQEFPPDGQPPPDIRGKTVRVSIEVQYDSPIPSTRTFKRTVQVP